MRVYHVLASVALGRFPSDGLESKFQNGKEGGMQMYIALQPLVALIAGILILIMPRLLNYIVAIYLIVIGILGLAKM